MALLLSAGVSPSARRPSFLKNQVYSSLSGFKLLSFSSPKTRLQLVQFQQSPMRLHVSCSAKPQTVEMVCEIVKKKLALPEDSSVNGQSTFSALGADSLDTLHLVTREMLVFVMRMMKYLPVTLLDLVVLLWCYLWFGNTSKYGLHRPSRGPVYLRLRNTPAIYPVVDSGAFAKIKSGDIEGDDYLIGEDGLSKHGLPQHFKGKNGLYCVGLSKRGLHGIAEDVVRIADDISSVFHN